MGDRVGAAGDLGALRVRAVQRRDPVLELRATRRLAALIARQKDDDRRAVELFQRVLALDPDDLAAAEACAEIFSRRREMGLDTSWKHAFDVIHSPSLPAIAALGAWGLNLQSQLAQAQAFDRAVTAGVQAGAQPGAKTVVLAAAPGKQGAGIGVVAADGSVTLALRDLPATSGNQVYTAWVIVGETPTAVGDFSVDATGIRGLTTKPATTPAGATIAVTLEPNPGNTAPKGEVIAAGVAAAPPGATS